MVCVLVSVILFLLTGMSAGGNPLLLVPDHSVSITEDSKERTEYVALDYAGEEHERTREVFFDGETLKFDLEIGSYEFSMEKDPRNSTEEIIAYVGIQEPMVCELWQKDGSLQIYLQNRRVYYSMRTYENGNLYLVEASQAENLKEAIRYMEEYMDKATEESAEEQAAGDGREK